jgi:hypothetical protein
MHIALNSNLINGHHATHLSYMGNCLKFKGIFSLNFKTFCFLLNDKHMLSTISIMDLKLVLIHIALA